MGQEREVDRLLREAFEGQGVLDPELTKRALRDMQEAIVRQMGFMKSAKYKRRVVEAKCRGCGGVNKFTLPQADPEAVGRAMAAMTKAGDSLARLGEFLAGKPDSRPDVGMDWLRSLTDEQLATVQGWVEDNGRRAGGRQG